MTFRKPTILVVEDLASELDKYLRFLREFQFETFGATTLEGAQSIIQNQHLDLILTDLHLSHGESRLEGLELISFAREEHPGLPVLAMSFDPRVDIAKEVRKRGAEHLIRKPIKSADELVIHVKRALERAREAHAPAWPMTQPLDKILRERYVDGIVITPEHRKYIEVAAKNPNLVVCIYGETGTGKEEIARLIHRKRLQQEATPFVSLNCANLQGDMMFSTLFGHKKGAFTGATENTVGGIGMADGGILFLDEVHRLSRAAQEMLLRVLNDGTYQRMGDTKELRSSFQILIASSKSLDEEVEQNGFLLDLRMRLIGLEIHLPPLRERKHEMADFIDLFFAKQDKKVFISDKEKLKLTERCKSFYWQGNIRQLYKVLQTFVIISSMNDDPLQADAMPVYKTMHAPGEGHDTGDKQSLLNETLGLIRSCEVEGLPLDDVLAAVEKLVIASSLRRNQTIVDACRELGISRSTIDLKRRKYGI
jgi:DNA-binding NtrC family response regulator